MRHGYHPAPTPSHMRPALQQQWARMPQQAALSGLGAAQKQRREVLKILSMLMAVGACSWLAVEQVPYRALMAEQRTGDRKSVV